MCGWLDQDVTGGAGVWVARAADVTGGVGVWVTVVADT